jgi:hypothetical protein
MARKFNIAQRSVIASTMSLSLSLLVSSTAWAAVVNVHVNVPIVHPKVAIVNVKPNVPHIAITAGSGSKFGSQSAGAGAGKVRFSDLHIIKTTNAASPNLFKSATSGTAKAALTSSCKMCGVTVVGGASATTGAALLGVAKSNTGSGAGTTTGAATTVFGVPKGATVGGGGATPPAVLAKYGKIAAQLDPAALGWLAQQGKALSQSPGVAVATVEATIAQHFGIQPGGNPDAAALALIVLVEAINNANQDLQQLMTAIQDQTAAKQALRNRINALNQQIAANGGQSEIGAQSSLGAPIQFGGTPSPTQVPTDGAPIAIGGSLVAPAQGGGAVSTSTVGTAVTTLQNDLDSENEMSEMTSMRLQMLMDVRSKLLQTASEIEKSISDTDVAILRNIKQ